jgi:hypothetical protein
VRLAKHCKYALLATALCFLASCKVAVIVVEGGQVESQGSGTCTSGSVCMHQVNNTSYYETFTAVADTGWQFVRWNSGGGFLCGDLTDAACVITTLGAQGAPLIEAVIASAATFNIMPVFELAPGTVQFSFESTVFLAINSDGNVPDGVAVGDTVTFTVAAPVNDATLLSQSSSCSSGYVGCGRKTWGFEPLKYEVRYSSGYVQSGFVNEIVIENSGYEVANEEARGLDVILFSYDDPAGGGAYQSIFEVTDADGLWLSGAISANLNEATATIDHGFLDYTFNYSYSSSSIIDWYTTSLDSGAPEGSVIVRKVP